MVWNGPFTRIEEEINWRVDWRSRKTIVFGRFVLPLPTRLRVIFGADMLTKQTIKYYYLIDVMFLF
jgi:hypothetical protein